ncbi:hypothetical protein Tco_1430070 [Tanacetum coccineum]
MESQSDSTQTVSSLKLTILKTGDYDLWSMRMEQYLTHTDYALWEVIVNGDAPAVASASTEAKSTLLLAIPDEPLLKFHGIKDAKSLWEAIKTRFGGNKESKKMQKTVLKQQYENFNASRSEGLDKIYDRVVSMKDLEQIDTDDLEKMDVKWRGHFARECRAPRNQGNRNGDVSRRIVPIETHVNALVVQDGIGGYDWSFL